MAFILSTWDPRLPPRLTSFGFLPLSTGGNIINLPIYLKKQIKLWIIEFMFNSGICILLIFKIFIFIFVFLKMDHFSPSFSFLFYF